ncbi:MAG: hypothetical protein OER88_08950, partial [Planctomycetota bacterium]|nr:hypothetical protein [Planctomycetota bacterium]
MDMDGDARIQLEARPRYKRMRPDRPIGLTMLGHLNLWVGVFLFWTMVMGIVFTVREKSDINPVGVLALAGGVALGAIVIRAGVDLLERRARALPMSLASASALLAYGIPAAFVFPTWGLAHVAL